MALGQIAAKISPVPCFWGLSDWAGATPQAIRSIGPTALEDEAGMDYSVLENLLIRLVDHANLVTLNSGFLPAASDGLLQHLRSKLPRGLSEE